MPNVYRAFPLNRSGKIYKPAHVLEAESDEQAIEAARPYVDGHDIEVWHGKKLIKTLRQHIDATPATPKSNTPTPHECRAKASELMAAADRTIEPAAKGSLLYEALDWLNRGREGGTQGSSEPS